MYERIPVKRATLPASVFAMPTPNDAMRTLERSIFYLHEGANPVSSSR